MSIYHLPLAVPILAIVLIILPCRAIMGQSADSGAPSPIRVERIGGDINTDYQEYAPWITSDGLKLYFVSDRPGGYGGHDIWQATKTDRFDREFTAPRNIGEPINTPMNEGTFSAAGDDGLIYFTACGRADGVGDCDIYQARFDGTTWSDIRNVRELNSIYWDAQPSISSDGRTIFFVSYRPGSIGGDDADIYIAYKGDDGVWSPPQNLGAPINTSERESSPFIAAGSGALYFASMGHEGYGGFDFFVAPKDTDGSWGTPRNLGAPINTPYDERFITLTPASDLLYFSSNRPISPGAVPTLDLYMVRPSHPLVPVLVTGRVYDRVTGAGLAAGLTLIDSAAGDMIASRTSDSATGGYSMALTGGAAMTMVISAQAPGYAPFAMTMHLPAAERYAEWSADIPLDAVPAGVVQPGPAASADDLVIFPNPSSGRMVIRYTGAREGSEQELVISDLYGGEMVRTKMSRESMALDLSDLPSGLYLVRAGSVTRLMVVRK